jgi:hypothetical protein
MGLDLAPIALGHRVAYGDAMIPGEGVTEHRPGSQSALEIEALFDWVMKKVDLSDVLPIELATPREVAR